MALNFIHNQCDRKLKNEDTILIIDCYLFWGVNSWKKGTEPRTYYPVGCHIEYMQKHRRRREEYMMKMPPSTDLAWEYWRARGGLHVLSLNKTERAFLFLWRYTWWKFEKITGLEPYNKNIPNQSFYVDLYSKTLAVPQTKHEVTVLIHVYKYTLLSQIFFFNASQIWMKSLNFGN